LLAEVGGILFMGSERHLDAARPPSV
jgi:hypothetical protein